MRLSQHGKAEQRTARLRVRMGAVTVQPPYAAGSNHGGGLPRNAASAAATRESSSRRLTGGRGGPVGSMDRGILRHRPARKPRCRGLNAYGT